MFMKKILRKRVQMAENTHRQNPVTRLNSSISKGWVFDQSSHVVAQNARVLLSQREAKTPTNFLQSYFKLLKICIKQETNMSTDFVSSK